MRALELQVHLGTWQLLPYRRDHVWCMDYTWLCFTVRRYAA